MDKSNEKNNKESNKESNKETRRINFLRRYSVDTNGEIKPLTGKEERGYEINKQSMGIRSEMPGNDI